MHASRFHAPQLPDSPTPKAGGQGGWARRVPQRRCWRRRSAPNSKIPECARPAIRTRDWRLKAGDPALRAAPRLGRLAPGIPPPAPHLIGRRHRPCSARHPSQSPYAAAPPSATAHPPPRRVSWSRAHARRVRRARLSLSAAPPPRRAAVTTCLRGSRRLWAVSGGSAARDAAAGARTGGDRVGRRRLRSCPPIEGGVWPVALRELRLEIAPSVRLRMGARRGCHLALAASERRGAQAHPCAAAVNGVLGALGCERFVGFR